MKMETSLSVCKQRGFLISISNANKNLDVFLCTVVKNKKKARFSYAVVCYDEIGFMEEK